jgi:subtilisin family serine protease
VPPGRDPGGVTIALLGTGIDYTSPQLAQRLARDGEGELIGWDVEDRDRQPLDRTKGDTRAEWGGDGTAIANFLSVDGIRLVPVRVNPTDPVSFARAIAFAAQTPARVAIVPMWGARREAWEPFRQAASQFKDILLIVPAGVGSEPVYPAALGLDNVLAVEHGASTGDAPGFGGRVQRISGAALAVAAAGKAAAAVLAREPRLDVAVLKRQLIEAGGDATWRARK